MTPRIDPEFAALLPKPSPDRLEKLVKRLQKEGCRDAIVVWREENIVIDGMTRFDICESLGIPYRIELMDFDSRDEIKLWMIQTQSDRRNFTDEQESYYRGLEYELLKQPHGGQKGGATFAPPSGKTNEIVGKRHGVSASTVKNDAKFADAVDTHEKVNPGSKDRILRGEGGSKKEVMESKPILCDRCQKNGPARNCRWCAEAADAARAKNKAREGKPILCKRCSAEGAVSDCPDCELRRQARQLQPGERTVEDQSKRPPVGAVESEDAELLTSCEKGGGHPFLGLMQEVSALSRKITKAMKEEGVDSQKLHEYLGWCGLLDHDPKTGNVTFLPLKGVVKVMGLAGDGGKMLTKQKVTVEYERACGVRPFIPILNAKRREKKRK